jgi:hypothetical protein
MDASFIVSSVAAAVAMFSAGIAVQANQEVRRANHLAIQDSLREWRELDASRRFVLQELRKRDASVVGITGLDEGARKHAVAVCHFLDHLGFLVDRGVVRRDDVAGLLGEAVLRNWSALSDFIREERRLRNSEYSQYFEHLAAEVLRTDPVEIRRHLRRVPRDATLPRILPGRESSD